MLDIIFLLLAYLCGSIPTGYLLAKWIKKVDIRTYGSGNTGATNSTRLMGPGLGFLVFIIDCLKAILVMLIVKFVPMNHTFIPLGYFGLAAVLGHDFSIFLKFKGGKAVSSSVAVLIVLSPISGAASILAFIIVMLISGIVSLSSLTGTIIGFISYSIILIIQQTWNTITIQNFVVLFIIVLLLFIRHIPNIKRLRNGTESSFKKK